MLIKGIDVEVEATQTKLTTDDHTSENAMFNPHDMINPSVPPPATSNPFGDGFVKSQLVDNAGDFKILTYGTAYGFALAPNKTYSMVFAVQFSPTGSFSAVEQQAVDLFAEYLPKAARHAYEVKGNKAQNAERNCLGRLWSSGWRPGRTEGEMFGEYTTQSSHNKHEPDGYIDLYEMQDAINSAWIILQEKLSPQVVMMTMETLADTAVPLFGSHDSDLATHGPSLGSNMAVSKHDIKGNSFANGMHIDQDMDSLPKYYGKVFTFSQWLHLDNHGQLVNSDKIKEAIPNGYFILPAYCIAIDLGAAAVATAIWHGRMDMHGTTTSTVNLESGITHWGMSIQTNRNLPARLRSGNGKIFGVYDRLQEYYELLAESCDEE